MENIDQIILEEFPYPIALSYQKLLATTDLTEQTELAMRVFHFSIRAVSFTTIIQYLTTPPEVLNDVALNQKIETTLKTPRTHDWVELLRITLHAYHNHRDLLFIKELYDLYWGETRDQVWSRLEEMAHLANDVFYPKGPIVNRAAVAGKTMGLLRKILNDFGFIRDYELWFIHNRDSRRLAVEIYRGQEKQLRNPQVETIKNLDHTKINIGYFYLRNNLSHLLELHPLVISSDYVHSREDKADTGVYEEFLDEEVTRTGDAELVYFMLRANELRRFVSTGAGKEAVALFQELYRHLERKQKDIHKPAALNPVNLQRVTLNYSSSQSLTALQKYIEAAYIERELFDRLFEAFLKEKEPLLIISGNVGVGKTNLLLHFYLKKLQEQSESLALWLDGPMLKPTVSLARTILGAWSNLNFEQPRDDIEATLVLKRILNEHFGGRQLIVLIDGVNENDHPMQIFDLINSFSFDFQETGMVKVIATTRPQVWQQARNKYLRMRYKEYNYFKRLPEALQNAGIVVDNDSVVLKKYGREELEKAYRKYTEYYRISGPPLQQLTHSLRQAVHEPLLLRLVCETHKESTIPLTKQADDIIGDLINSVQQNPNINLYESDFEFLQRWIVPQFFPEDGAPVAVLKRKQLLGVHVLVGTSGITLPLDRLITDITEYSDGTSINVHAQRLMDTGWLTLTGTPADYELRFRYEYFYDFFVGKHISSRYETSSDRLKYFEQLIQHLKKAPYLWGALRNLLADILNKGHYDFIQALGFKPDALQSDLIISVLLENYDKHVQGLEKILFAWVNSNNVNAGKIAAVTAIEFQVRPVLKYMLNHKARNIRLHVIQNIYQLWKKDQPLTIELLQELADRIRLYSLPRNVRTIETLLQCSFLLFMADYVAAGANTPTASALQSLWQPIIQRLLLVSRVPLMESLLKRVRRTLLALIAGRVINVLEGIDRNNNGMFSFSFYDLEKAFPATKERREIFARIIPHMDAANASPEPMPVLYEYLAGILKDGVDDFATMMLVCAVIAAHFYRDPLETTTTVNKLSDIVFSMHPAVDHPDQSTADLWLCLLYTPLNNASAFISRLDKTTMEEILEMVSGLEYAMEQRYWSSWKLKNGKKLRTIIQGGGIVNLYAIGADELGVNRINRIIDLTVKRKDYERIAQLPLLLFRNKVSPRASVRAFQDAMTTVIAYLKRGELDTAELWDGLANNFIKYIGNIGEYSMDLIEMLEANADIPVEFRVRISKAAPEENFDYQFTAIILFFVIAALKNPDSSIRDILKWGFSKSVEVDDLKGLIIECVMYLGNIIYKEGLF